MALTATIYRVELQIADMDRGYYTTHPLTVARHPSETEERLMVRLLAFALHASERLEFTRGLCVDDEPELWSRDLTGEIDLWIDIGQPDERRIRKACHRASAVAVYAYGGQGAELWWEKLKNRVERFGNLQVHRLPAAATRELGTLAQRSLALQCTIQDGLIWLGDGRTTVSLQPEHWL